MAVSNEPKMATATTRRLFFGANVTVVVLLAVVVLVAVNLLGHRHNQRKDLAGGLASHRLSERTKSILDKVDGKLTVTTVYTSDEPESNRKDYLPRLQDYLEEMGQFKRSVAVEHLHSGNERAALRDRVQGKFGEASEKYKEVLGLAEQTWNGLQEVLKRIQGQAREQLGGGSWLSGFSTLANIEAVMRKDLEDLEEVRREVNDAVRGEGIPRYQEANNKIKSSNDTFKQHLESVQTWVKDTDKLVQVLSEGNSDFAAKSKENLAVLQGLLLNMKKALGDAQSRDVTGDPVGILKEYAKAANALSKFLFDEHTRVSAFVKDNPGLEQHPRWSVRVQVAIFDTTMPAHGLLEECSQQVGPQVEVLRRVLEKPAQVSELEQKNLVLKLRQGMGPIEKMLGVWSERINSVLADAGKIDEGSKQFLAKGVSGDLFAAPAPSTQPGVESKETQSIITQLTEVGTKIDDLPKLELDEIADRMKEDNIVVLETDKSVRVVPFDEVWPAAAPDSSMMGEEKAKLHRVFDGDRAISSAINSLYDTKKVATVILVAFESEPPPQMRQFQRGSSGPIPLAQLSVLKDRLTKANFSVKDWNLAGGPGEDAKKPTPPPAPDEGTRPIYVFLPPAEAQPPNPMMQQAPPPSFGPEELKQIKDVLARDGRGIFLAIADASPRPTPWAPPPSYVYRDMLRDEWGLDVKFDYRVIRGVRDPQRPERFGIDIIGWTFMPLNNFTDHPIGAPLKARRLLMAEACPVVKADQVPDGVTVSPVLEVPTSAADIWADPDIGRIFKVLREGQRDSTFTKGPNVMDQGFSVIETSENTKTGSKIVVMGVGFSFIDGYITRPVPRLEAKKVVTLETDPPPAENVDLVLNTLFWLADQP
ncbi:MAG: hypothetical protein HY718_09750, partial [Planctomycetes bacterium]|nr:hypothetical protein [Planctomycetota bacterium]